MNEFNEITVDELINQNHKQIVDLFEKIIQENKYKVKKDNSIDEKKEV